RARRSGRRSRPRRRMRVRRTCGSCAALAGARRRQLAPAGQTGGLPEPVAQAGLVEVALVEVDPATVVARAAGWDRTQPGAGEEGQLHVAGEDVVRDDPAAVRQAVEGRVPAYRLADAGNLGADQCVEPAADVLLPVRQRRDIGLDRRVAVAFGD